MKVLSCPICGSYDFSIHNDMYECNNCGAKFKDFEIEKSIEDMKNSLKNYIDETEKQKQEKKISALRNNLFFELKKDFLSSNSIYNFSLEIKKILPNDLFGNFFYIASSNNINDLQRFISNTDFKNQNIFFVNTIVEFLLKSPTLLTKQIPTLLNEIIDTCYSRSSVEWNTYYKKFTEEMKKIDSGFFDVTLPRDVFIAYSSKDKPTVLKVVEFLEKQDISCFVAFRNLQHGSGSIENYEKDLFTAIDNSKVFLFISSTNSRTKSCDALKVEMQYIMDKDKLNLPPELKRHSYDKIPLKFKKPRAEFIAQDYNGENIIGESISNLFFSKIERVYDIKELGLRIYNLLQENPEEEIIVEKKETPKEVKFCGYCGTENPINTKFCIECGKNVFGKTLLEARNLVKEIFKKENEQTQNNNLNENTFNYNKDENNQKVKYCTFCKAENPLMTNYCVKCGNNSFSETLSLDSNEDFVIENNTLTKYKGSALKISIPEGVEIINRGVFSYNKELEEIELPTTLKTVRDMAFVGISNVKKIFIKDLSKYLQVDFEGDNSCPFQGANSLCKLYVNNIEVKDLVLPKIKELKAKAFLLLNIKSVTVSEGTEILNTFCLPSAEEIYFPSTLKKIYKSAAYIGERTQLVYNGSKSEWDKIKKHSEWCGTKRCVDENIIFLK